jgi:hypothetical protein
MDDTISREAAINAIISQPPEPHYPSWYAEQIKAFPPAQLERKKGKWKCSDDMYETATCSCCGYDTNEPWGWIREHFFVLPELWCRYER